MSDLTDLEICKRIAEIEGRYKTIIERMNDHQKNHDSFNRDCPNALYSNPYNIKPFEQLYNPLTDDGLCFQLMVKYGVTASFVEDEAYIYNDYKTKSICFNKDKQVNKAICLAIIASKE